MARRGLMHNPHRERPAAVGQLRIPDFKSRSRPMTGITLAQYRIDAELGRGGMGAAWRTDNVLLYTSNTDSSLWSVGIDGGQTEGEIMVRPFDPGSRRFTGDETPAGLGEQSCRSVAVSGEGTAVIGAEAARSDEACSGSRQTARSSRRSPTRPYRSTSRPHPGRPNGCRFLPTPVGSPPSCERRAEAMYTCRTSREARLAA